ncbi:MAG: antibiotic biosynthesis monooxygenase [Desulfofustis sp.]|nr:antibiotic biosynthesis monooxygenase [Desulfofustis sp.]MBT8355088.1 antibiotic biosynthesis monooxygenase [Desulfofustis sp.]
MYIVTVKFTIKPDNVDEFTKVMKRQAQNSLNKEDGCLQFDVCQDPSDSGSFFLYEVYVDSEAFEAHLQTAHFSEFDRTVKGWTESKVAEKWNRLKS